MSRYNNAALGRIAVGVFDCGDFKTSPKSIELLADIIRRYDLMLLAGVTMVKNGVNVLRDRVNAGQDAEHPYKFVVEEAVEGEDYLVWMYKITSLEPREMEAISKRGVNLMRCIGRDLVYAKCRSEF